MSNSFRYIVLPTPAFGHPSQEGKWGNIPSSGGVRSPQENGGRVDYVPINISEWYKSGRRARDGFGGYGNKATVSGRERYPSRKANPLLKTDGFTFIEVLFALFIAGFMALTVGYTMILSLRAEERGRGMQEGLLILSSHHAAVHLGLDEADSALAEHTAWRLSDELLTVGREPTQTIWRVTRIRHPQTDFRATIALRDGTE